MYGGNYPAETSAKCLEVRSYTLTERLTQEKENLENRLADVNASLNALNSSPQIQTVLDLLQKTRCI